MPYITEEKRRQIDTEIDNIHQALVNMQLDDEENNMEGNLNYIFTRLLMMVYGDKYTTSYSDINDALGVLSAVKTEYYRKVAVPYEDQKEFDNGHIIAFKNHEPEIVGVVDIEATPEEVMKKVSEKIKHFFGNEEDDNA